MPADGTAARIKRITAISSSTTIMDPGTRAPRIRYNITLEGLARVRLPSRLPPVLSMLPPIPLPISTFSLPLPLLHAADAPDFLALARPLIPVTLPSLKGRLDDAAEQKITAMAAELETHLQTLPNGLAADIVATMLGLDFEVRVDMLGLVDVQARCERLERALRDLIVAKGIPMPIPDMNTRATSKALIRRPIGPSSGPIISPNLSRSSTRASGSPPAARVPEDVQPLISQLEQRQHDISPSALTAIQRELARLVKIPAQSAEYGVVKTYIELLLALPWDRVSEMGEVDLARAKEVLERDHEGLKEVKTRVVEYLAVYK